MNAFFQRLRERKLVQWAVAYVAAAFALLQGIDIVAQQFGWPEGVRRGLTLAMVVGFFVTLVLAWYHGERGAQRVNGVELLILALLLSLGGVFLWRFAVAAPAPTSAPPSAVRTSGIPAKSIAVLPFDNLSDDKSNAYFASGMQDMILTKLAAIGDLKVISRTSTERYKSHPDDLKSVGQQLGVAALLEGSVQKAGDQVLINVQLIEAATDRHLWAEAYPRTLQNIFGVEGEVAEKVANALQAKLAPAESERVAKVPTKNPEAYDFFLKAQYLLNQLQISAGADPRASGSEANDLYARAVAADPDFALAYARWSFLESYLHWYNVDHSSEIIASARLHAERALALQPNLPEAHLALGYSYYYGRREYDAALREFAIARAGLPNNAEIISAIGYVHRRQGDPSRGIPDLQQAMELDPRDTVLPREIGNSYTALRRYAEADSFYARSLALAPNNLEALQQRANNSMFRGDVEAAARLLAEIPDGIDPEGAVSLVRFRIAMRMRQPDQALASIAHSPDWLMTRWEHSVVPVGLLRAEALTVKGDHAGARAAYLEAENKVKATLAKPTQVADAQSYLCLIYAGLGQKEDALKAGRAAVDAMPMSRDVIVGAFYLERLARTEALVGETQAAIEHLEQLMARAGGETVSVATLRIDPAWDSLRGLAAFQALFVKYAAAP